MKTYVFTKQEKVSKYYTNVKCNIYRLKRNKPVFVTSCKFNTGNTYGTKNEVFQALVEHGELSKSMLKLSESEWCSAGYYCDKVYEKGVQIIELS